jgi:hypothetical protein
LFRTIEGLERRSTSDLSAFVEAWHPRVVDSTALWFDMRRRMLKVLYRSLWRPSLPIGYLRPLQKLLQSQEQITVASLNYDNVVETFCLSEGLPYDTGIGELSGYFADGYRINRVKVGISLLKLHGSLNWVMHEPVSPTSGRSLFPEGIVTTWGGHDPGYERNEDYFPAVLFGAENKLTAKGPFLELFTEFQAELRRADRLIVVGYSFRDHHVNSRISWFLHSRNDREIVIIDPTSIEKSHAVGALGEAGADRVRHVRGTAAEGLAELFGSRS